MFQFTGNTDLFPIKYLTLSVLPVIHGCKVSFVGGDLYLWNGKGAPRSTPVHLIKEDNDGDYDNSCLSHPSGGFNINAYPNDPEK